MTPRLTLNVLGKQEDTYYVCVLLGICAALIWMIGISIRSEFETGFILLLFFSYLFGSYAFNVVRSFIFKHPENTLYHHFLLLLGITFLMCLFAGKGFWRYFDVYVVSFSICSAFGRVGCYHAGCCHGKKWKWGSKYPTAYFQYLKSNKLLNTTLFPSQKIESGVHLVHFILGLTLIIMDTASGLVFSILTISYAFIRFCLEFFRGDKRNTALSISEAQWTATGILFVMLIGYYNNVHFFSGILLLLSIQVILVIIQIKTFAVERQINRV